MTATVMKTDARCQGAGTEAPIPASGVIGDWDACSAAPREPAYFRAGPDLPAEYRPDQKAVSAVPRAPAAVRVVADRQAASYAERREELYGALREAGVFTWDSMYGEEYALASVWPISGHLLTELRQAAEALGAIFARTAAVVMQAEDELPEELGLPPATWGALRTSLPELLPTVLGRFDFALTPDGLKMLEFNAETPTDVVEAFYVNGKVCEYFGKRDPNAGLTAGLAQAFAGAVRAYRERGFATERMVFSSVDWHLEDAGTTKFLLSQSGLDAEFVPLSRLRVYENRIQVWDGIKHSPVDLMYRLHPLEKLAEEQDSDGYPTGRHALEIIRDGKLALINPPAALISQSKAMQALIWNLHETGEFFTPAEHKVIQKYWLPTYFENQFLDRSAYVTKPVFGREGGAVTLFGPDGAVWVRDEKTEYWEQPLIYQQYAELSQSTVETLNGWFCGRMIFGVFWVAGKGSGVVARVGGRITGDMAYYQALCVSDDAPKGE